MKVEHIHEGKRYVFSDEGIVAGTAVFPIANGRINSDNEFVFHDFTFEDYMTGFPDEPHTILDTKYSTYKPYEVRTDHGFGPIEKYFRLVLIEDLPPRNSSSLMARQAVTNLNSN